MFGLRFSFSMKLLHVVDHLELDLLPSSVDVFCAFVSGGGAASCLQHVRLSDSALDPALFSLAIFMRRDLKRAVFSESLVATMFAGVSLPVNEGFQRSARAFDTVSSEYAKGDSDSVPDPVEGPHIGCRVCDDNTATVTRRMVDMKSRLCGTCYSLS